MRREETVDDGVGGRVEGRQALDEGGDCGVGSRGRNVSIHLQEIEHYVGAPAQDEDWNGNRAAGLTHSGGQCLRNGEIWN